MDRTLFDLLDIESDTDTIDTPESRLDTTPVEDRRPGVTYAYIVDGPRGHEVHNHVAITD